jgi:hypothetical protein
MADEMDDLDLTNKDLKNTLNAWRESADQQAEKPDWFWARQRALVSSRIQQREVRHMPKLAWAGIAATLAIGAALMIPADHRSNNDSGKQQQPQVTAQISDHELMQGLEETMNSGVPEALQPARTLQQEMESAYSAQSTTTGKETRQ